MMIVNNDYDISHANKTRITPDSYTISTCFWDFSGDNSRVKIGPESGSGNNYML